MASPDHFIPEVPGWRDRSLFIVRRGMVDFFHYDPYSQALAKLERGHPRDADDVRAMLGRGLIDTKKLIGYFEMIQSELIKFPSIEPALFRQAVADFCTQ